MPLSVICVPPKLSDVRWGRVDRWGIDASVIFVLHNSSVERLRRVDRW